MNDYLECIAKFQNGIEVGYREEFVRCRECIRRGTYDCPIYVGGDADHGSPDDWFCADGERKSADEILNGRNGCRPIGLT